MIPSLTDFELRVLRDIAEPGSQPVRWGGAKGAALEYLQEHGFVSTGSKPTLTPLGRRALNSSSASPSSPAADFDFAVTGFDPEEPSR